MTSTPAVSYSMGAEHNTRKPLLSLRLIGTAAAASGRAREDWIVAPGPAAHHPEYVSTRFPDRTIRGRTVVVVVPSILAPFPDVAVHLVQPEGVGRECAHRHGLPSVFALGRAVVGGVAVEVGLVSGDARVEVERRAGARPAGVFPFRLAGQPIGPPRLFAQPGAVGFGIVPGDVDDRPVASTPALVFGFRLFPGILIAVVVVEGHRVHPQSEGFGDADFVLRPFAVPPSRFVRRRTHDEPPGGDDHHQRAFAADLQFVPESLTRCFGFKSPLTPLCQRGGCQIICQRGGLPT